MPCDIGYKNVAKVVIPTPQPLNYKLKVTAPKVDADLMAKIGQDDPEFLAWMNEIDADPLLSRALQNALAVVKTPKALRCLIQNGNLIAKATYLNPGEKRAIETAAEKVAAQWQMEVLKMVAELLDFETALVRHKDGSIMLEAERHGNTPVNEYLRVTFDPARGSSLVFEHFASAEALEKTRTKFLGLAQKLGVRITTLEEHKRGNPIPTGIEHKHFLKHRK